MPNKVLHCSECERMQCMEYPYKNYYCCVENEPMQVLGYIGVDTPPKTSPKWCPKRKGYYEKY